MQSQPNDPRADLVRTFSLLGEARFTLNELVAVAPEPTASISAAMSERIYQEQERVRSLLRASERSRDEREA